MMDKEIDKLQESLCAVADAFQNVAKAAMDAFKRICEEIKSDYPEWIEKYYEHKAHIEDIRSGWQMKRDTRRRSQVIDRRPKFAVRKVIR